MNKKYVDWVFKYVPIVLVDWVFKATNYIFLAKICVSTRIFDKIRVIREVKLDDQTFKIVIQELDDVGNYMSVWESHSSFK